MEAELPQQNDTENNLMSHNNVQDEFRNELEAYRYLKGMRLPGVVFKPSRMSDSLLDSSLSTGTDATI